MEIATLTRPCLKHVSPYLPGKPIAEVQRELGLKRVVKLASNENPLGPSPRALAALRRAAADVHFYPEGASPLLRRSLAQGAGLSESQVFIGNGSDEIIHVLSEAFLSPADEVVVSQYAFIRFKQHAMLMGARVVEVPMKCWRHDLEAMAQAVTPRTKLVFVANPNNPTGTYNTREELAAFLDRLPRTALAVLDEAYFEYAVPQQDYPVSLREFLPRHPNLVVLRTFSKAYGLAGLRVGWAAAHAETVSWLDRIRMPFNVNLPAQRAAVEALKDKAFVRRSVSMVAKNRAALTRSLRSLGLEVTDSLGNFVFLQAPMPGAQLFQRLLRAGVIVRSLDEYGLPRHVRISVGTHEQNKLLLSAMGEALAARE